MNFGPHTAKIGSSYLSTLHQCCILLLLSASTDTAEITKRESNKIVGANRLRKCFKNYVFLPKKVRARISVLRIFSLVVARESGPYRRWCPQTKKDYKFAKKSRRAVISGSASLIAICLSLADVLEQLRMLLLW